MGYFSTMLQNRYLEKHDKPALWNYQLSEFEFRQLQAEINQANLATLDIRDCALYYGEWWKRHYNGGIPSKEEVFKSLGRAATPAVNVQSFFHKAKHGAQLLGLKWIEKHNTLYFRTLLLQGGLPIRHISANKSSYQTFLLKLLEVQPNSVEEIELLPELTKLLPSSSRNHDIYENCLAVIRSILNDEDLYAGLFEDNTALKEIHTALKIQNEKLGKRTREKKPKIFWVMKDEKGAGQVCLHIAFADKYTPKGVEEVLNLSGPAIERTYRLYLDDKLICSFRKTLGEEYKTQWEPQSYYQWELGSIIPQFYWESENERKEVDGLITGQPTVYEPSLWAAFGENQWRLVKGNAVNAEKALLVFPLTWQPSKGAIDTFSISNLLLGKAVFEGEIQISSGEQLFKFFTNVESFDWYIKSEKPSWMRKSDLVIVSRNLKAFLYDSQGNIIPVSQYKVFYKSSESYFQWKILDNAALPNGLVDVKMEWNGLTAYDKVYNIGNLALSVLESNLLSASLQWEGVSPFNLSLVEGPQFAAHSERNKIGLQLNLDRQSIPEAIQFKLKLKSQRALCFDITTPLSGVGLVGKDSLLIPENCILTLGNLQGIRILTAGSGETLVKLHNKLRSKVKISKIVTLQHQPLISYKEDLHRLFYLADAMRHDNIVEVEISNRGMKRCYSIKWFSHMVKDVFEQLQGKIKIENPGESLQVLAIPINSKLSEIDPISMECGDDCYTRLPNGTAPGQFIIVSPLLEGKQLQPRFINTDPGYDGSKKNNRLERIHDELTTASFDDRAWKELSLYYKICLAQKLPFSTFDQIRAIGFGSKLAARAFFFLGVQQEDKDEFIQSQVKGLELDIGFNFHWVEKKQWEDANAEVVQWIGVEYIERVFTLMAKYFQEVNLTELYRFLLGQNIVNTLRINNQVILEARAQLGQRVLSELPEPTPATNHEYNIPVANNAIVKLLLRSPIAVAESIKGVAEKSIWANSDFVADLRRNIQYAQFIAPELYSKVLYHCLSQSSNN